MVPNLSIITVSSVMLSGARKRSFLPGGMTGVLHLTRGPSEP